MSDKPMSGSVQPRVFLVVVDETEEYRIAVHYAARRAAHTGGRVALLYVIEPAEMQQWMAVEELAREERRRGRAAAAAIVRRNRADRRRDADRLHPRGT